MILFLCKKIKLGDVKHELYGLMGLDEGIVHVDDMSKLTPPQVEWLGNEVLFVESEKQTKIRKETGSNLSLGTRLTVLSKCLGRKRCCDTTPDHC